MIKEVDHDMFASGIAAKEEEHRITTTAADGIEEFCPSQYCTPRADVAYGEYTHGTYYSETCKRERGYCILLPASYSAAGKYPVLYMLHGIFGDEYSFSRDPENRIREIVGNMAADGLIEDTIIVCPDMYASADPEQKPGFDEESVLPYDNFINDLVDDLMPHIEKEYAAGHGRENTYLAGFSMGGRETIYIVLKRPELFAYACAISSAPGVVPAKDRFMTHRGMLAESEMKFAEDAVEPESFILCCGTNDSIVGEYPKSYHEILKANGAAHIWYEVSGADHDNNAVRSGIYNLFSQISRHKFGRIMEMEAIFDKAEALAAADVAELREYEPMIRKLEEYYEGPLWKEDFEADEAGRLPAKLKRGVLSEDGVYNLLEKIDIRLRGQ